MVTLLSSIKAGKRRFGSSSLEVVTIVLIDNKRHAALLVMNNVSSFSQPLFPCKMFTRAPFLTSTKSQRKPQRHTHRNELPLLACIPLAKVSSIRAAASRKTPLWETDSQEDVFPSKIILTCLNIGLTVIFPIYSHKLTVYTTTSFINLIH